MMPSIGPDMIISPKKLEGIDSATLAKFLSDNNKALIQRINDMIKEQLLKGEVDGCEPAFAADPDFKAKWFGKWYTALRNRLCFNSSKGSGLSLVFPIAVYLHDAYGLTCSKLLLGTEMPVVPPTWVQNWLTLAGKLTMEETSQLYDIFDLSSPEKADLVFTLKSRILEMAAERGARPDEFFMYPGLLEFEKQLLVSSFKFRSRGALGAPCL